MKKRILLALGLVGLLALGSACSKKNPFSPASGPTPTPTPRPLPMLYVALGDSMSFGYGLTDFSLCFVNLLYKNNNIAYPADAGEDLSTKYPGILLSNFAIPGFTTFSLIQSELPLVPKGALSPNFITLEIGGNELLNSCAGGAPCDGAVFGCSAAQGTSFSYAFKARLENRIIKVLQDRSQYPRVQKIVIWNLYDPTDGEGLPSRWPDGEAVLAQYNQRIAEAAAETGVDFVDVHTPFLGHGIYYNNPTNPYYHPNDPTFWLIQATPLPIHPNPTGHHVIKQLLWPHF